LIVSLFVFIILIPPISTFIRNNTVNVYWFAFVIALLVWSFIFIMLHVLDGKRIQQDNDAMIDV
jgi:hypothetical protein